MEIPSTTPRNASARRESDARPWAIGALASQFDDPSLRWSYLQHVEEGLAQKDRCAGDYLAFDHWVPQFAVYALTLDYEEEKRQR